MLRADMSSTLHFAHSVLGFNDLPCGSGYSRNSMPSNSVGRGDSGSGMLMGFDGASGQLDPNSRKGPRLQGRGKRYANKIARQLGLAYTTKDGKVVPAKVPLEEGILCTCKCRLKCNDIPKAIRQSIHNNFYSMDENGKNTYIFKCVHAYIPRTGK